MIVKIETGKVEIAEGILNPEPIMIKLENTLKQRSYIMAQLKCYYESDTELLNPFIIGGLPDEVGSDTDNLSNFTMTARFVLRLVKNRYNLQDSDIKIVIEEIWVNPERVIRVYIPYKVIIDSYSDLIFAMKELSVPYHEVDTGYVIYLETILEEHMPILNADPNILIEYKNI
jgi:hypothetical protein